MRRLAEGWRRLLRRWRRRTGKPTASGEVAVERANDGGKERGRGQRRRVVLVPFCRSFPKVDGEKGRTSTGRRSREQGQTVEKRRERKNEIKCSKLADFTPTPR
jgi:hypothetical protein